jgi:hypothetical protein
LSVKGKKERLQYCAPGEWSLEDRDGDGDAERQGDEREV